MPLSLRAHDKWVAGVMCVAATLFGASTLHAQVGTGGTVSNNNGYMQINDYTGGPTGTGATTFFSVNGPGGSNNVSQAWWWGRVTGSDPREFAVSVSNAVSTFSNVAGPGGDAFTVTYVYNRTVAGGAVVPTLSIAVTWQVIGHGLNEFGRPYASFVQTALVTNLTGSGANNPATSFTFNLYNYNNFAPFGGALNKTAVQLSPSTIRFLDGADPLNRADYIATPGPGGAAPTIQVTNVTGVGSVRSLLTNSGVNNLVSSIAAGPADLEVASQFVFTLAAGQAQSANVRVIIPTPGAAALLSLGGLVAVRRRRRS